LRVREFLARNGIPHEWLDPDRDAAVERLLREFAVTPGELPVVIVSGSVLRRPTPGGLAEYLGLTITSLPERRFDLVVVGAWPAGPATGDSMLAVSQTSRATVCTTRLPRWKPASVLDHRSWSQVGATRPARPHSSSQRQAVP